MPGLHFGVNWYTGVQERRADLFSLLLWFIAMLSWSQLISAAENQLCTFLPNSVFSDLHVGSLSFDMLGAFTPWKLACSTNQAPSRASC